MEKHSPGFWCGIYLFGMIGMFGICFVRLVFLQVFYYEEHAKTKNQLISTHLPVERPRGEIKDARGYTLAMSIRKASLCVYPKQIPLDCDKLKAARKIARIIQKEPSYVYAQMQKKSNFRWIKRILPDHQERQLRLLNYRFLGFIPEFERKYPGTDSFGHLIGYTGIDDQGLSGLELSCDKWLQNNSFSIFMRKDNRGRLMFDQLEDVEREGEIKNIHLTIDSVIQTFTEEAVRVMVEKFKPKGATGIVYNVNSGELLALVSFPTFNNNFYKDYSPDVKRNRAISIVYDPGSTFKSITMAAALNEGVVRSEDKINCGNGAMKICGRVLHDTHGHGVISAEQVLVKSSNIGAAKIAAKLGAEKFHDYIKAFGFGSKTNVGIAGEERGIFRHVSRWDKLTMRSLPMGQGISVTPMQLVVAYGAIANAGVLLKPHILKKVVTEEGRVIKSWKPEVVRRVLNPKASRETLDMLSKVVLPGGTGTKAYSKLYSIGGKTGTTQKLIDGQYSKKHHIGSFIGVAPIENPKIVVLVVLDDPIGKGYGGVVAAPAVKSIIENTLQYLNVPSNLELAELEEE